MNLDVSAKRYFPVLVCVLLATVAYFQASGVGDMVAGSVADTPPRIPQLVRAPDKRVAPSDAKPILERNAFDSVTGPLAGLPPIDSPKLPEEVKKPTGEPSIDTPACDFGRVTLIAATSDPARSHATIVAGGKAEKRIIGDEVNGHAVEQLTWNRVYLAKEGTRCQMKLGDKSHKAKKATPARKPKRRRRRRARSTKLPAELANKIQRISATEFKIERSVVDEILDKQAELMRFTRLRPIKTGDKVSGLRVSRVRKGSLLATLGINNGDQLQTINGFELTNPQKALEAYGRLRTADSLKLQVLRAGKPVTIEFQIQ